MKCYKCGKEMDREDGGYVLKGKTVDTTIDEAHKTRETIDYCNIQLGKYSDGNGECHLGICYECYIDKEFGIS